MYQEMYHGRRPYRPRYSQQPPLREPNFSAPPPLKSALKNTQQTAPPQKQQPQMASSQEQQKITPAQDQQKQHQQQIAPAQDQQQQISPGQEQQKQQQQQNASAQEQQSQVASVQEQKKQENQNVELMKDDDFSLDCVDLFPLENMEQTDREMKKKLIFAKGRISKREKRGRRNKRLRKILIPKNALMVLNELVGCVKYDFIEPNPPSSEIYIATTTVENVEYKGFGKSKNAAKSEAAEKALRHIILKKIDQRQISSAGEDSEISMDTSEDDKHDEDDLSWLHVASFAMHKLFSNWYTDEFPNNSTTTDAASNLLQGLTMSKPQLRRPAKELPEHPTLINPVMLLYQMRDNIVFEEYERHGESPNTIFVMKLSVDGFNFYGKGKTKKSARKNCAYAACSQVFGLTYPREEFDPTFVKIENA